VEIPESMKAELATWNNGDGVDLETWHCCLGNYASAVGYSTLFWPTFCKYKEYIFRAGVSSTSIQNWESTAGVTKKSLEWTINHIHISDLYPGVEDYSNDKALFIANNLKEIYQAKLNWQFPNDPCIVEVYMPESEDDFVDYQLSFWQQKHEN
jgi:hypothetical protein